MSPKPLKAPASCACVHVADTWCSDETWCRVKKTMRKEFIQPAARSTDPAEGGQQAASSGSAAGRHQAIGHMFATSQGRAASRNDTKFVCVGCRTKHLEQLESKNILVREMREILSFRGDHSRSAFPNGNNLTNESNTVLRGRSYITST